LLKGSTKGLVISSREVMRLHGPALLAALSKAGLAQPRVVLLRDGEGAKTVREWERMVRAMAQSRLDRSSVVVAFGGGSIGDAAGFAAATYMRGIRFVQIPTTLLAMVDSSVGGKTGINIKEGKNLVGSFHQPSLVLADLDFLKTLSARERQSGVYEILKCGLLRNAKLVDLMDETRGLRQATEATLTQAIAAAVAIKARIVERDEREAGERVLLNLGHTLGHALEAATSYGLFTHGEAVGHGLEFAVDLSESLGVTDRSTARRMTRSVGRVGDRTPLQKAMIAPARRASLSDKKRQGAQLTEVLLAAPGRPVIHRMSAQDFGKAAEAWLKQMIEQQRGRSSKAEAPARR